MEVRYIGENIPGQCTKGYIYVVSYIENDNYHIIDNSGIATFYPASLFETVGGGPEDVVDYVAVKATSSEDEEYGRTLFNEGCDLIDTDGNGNKKDYIKAVELLEKAFELGNIDAANNLGMMYYRGYGVEKNNPLALKMFRKAAACGSDVAYEKLAMLYLKGHGVIQNKEIARDMYITLAAKKSTHAMNVLGYLYYHGIDDNPDYEKSFYWYSKSAEMEDKIGLEELGHFYEKGIYVKQDYKKAMDCYAEAAYKDDIYAFIDIGSMYYFGNGVKQDYGQALAWSKEAAIRGYGVAMNNIASLYENGYGVEKNFEVAYNWFKRALEAGFEYVKDAVEKLQQNNYKTACPLTGKKLDDCVCEECKNGDGCPYSFNSNTELKVLCPCCGEGYVELGHLYDVCEVCWWEDDPVQYWNPFYMGGANKQSLFQNKRAYKKGIRFPKRDMRFRQIKKARKMLKNMRKRIRESDPCPCCGKTMVEAFDTCPVCGWCNDYGSNWNPNERDMPNNDLSLNEARALFRETGKYIPYEGTYYKIRHKNKNLMDSRLESFMQKHLGVTKKQAEEMNYDDYEKLLEDAECLKIKLADEAGKTTENGETQDSIDAAHIVDWLNTL